MGADENRVQVIFEGDIYALQESADRASDAVDGFKDKTEGSMGEASDAMSESSESAADSAQIMGSSFMDSSAKGAQGVNILTKALLLGSKVFDENAKKTLIYAVELGHMARVIPLANKGIKALSVAMQGLAISQAAVLLTNPAALAVAGIAATVGTMYYLANSTKVAGDEAEKAGEKFKKMWEFHDGALRQTNWSDELDDRVSRAQAALNEALEKRKALPETPEKSVIKSVADQFGDQTKADDERDLAMEKRKADKKIQQRKDELAAAQRQAQVDKDNKASEEHAAHEDYMSQPDNEKYGAWNKAAAKARAAGKSEEDARHEGWQAQRKANDEAEEKTEEGLAKRRRALRLAMEALSQTDAAAKAAKAADELGPNASDDARAEAERLSLEEGTLAVSKAISDLNKDLSEQEAELGMTSIAAGKAAKEYEKLKQFGGADSMDPAQLKEYREELDRMSRIALGVYLRDTTEDLELQTKMLGMASTEAKRYAEGAALLKKLGLEHDSAEGKQALAKLGEKQALDVQSAVKTTIEGLADEAKQLRMSADMWTFYQSQKKAGIDIFKGDMPDLALNNAQRELAALKTKQNVQVPGALKFENTLNDLQYQFKSGDIDKNTMALAMQNAEREFLPQTFKSSLGDVKSTWDRIQTNSLSDSNPQVKATKELANKIENTVLGKAEHAKLLAAIPDAIKQMNRQVP
jgi:hypothetical protein